MSDYQKGWTKPPATDDQPAFNQYGIPSEAIEPWMRLQIAIQNIPNTPCNSDNRGDWTSGRGNASQRAIEGCMGCPVLQECRAYAEAANETGAVWGAVSR